VKANGEQQLAQIEEEVTRLGETARRALADAVRALVDGDAGVAMRVLAGQPDLIAVWHSAELQGQALLAETRQSIEVQSRIVLALEVGLIAGIAQVQRQCICQGNIVLDQQDGSPHFSPRISPIVPTMKGSFSALGMKGASHVLTNSTLPIPQLRMVARRSSTAPIRALAETGPERRTCRLA